MVVYTGRNMDRKGICVAGNMIVDILYPVRALPRPGELTTIQDGIERTTGGALCNVIENLAAIDSSLPLTALGRVGLDSEGDFVLDSLSRYQNIDFSMITRGGKTAFTAVMEDVVSKERTFYTYCGANAIFCEDDIDWDRINSAFLHIGYILLLDALDQEDDQFGTKMARLLCHARERGIKTSLDVVSEKGDRFKRLVPPSLKYADYCIINEIEAEQITGVPLRNGQGGLISAHIPEALEAIRGFGVSQWSVIHCPEGGYGLDHRGVYAESPAIDIPHDSIKRKVGAGDAFCAGVLYAAYQKESLKEALEWGNTAAASLLTGGIAAENVEGLRRYRSKFRRLTLT